MNTRTKKMTTIAMLVAASFVAVTLFRIPIILFLKYEPKDVIITIGGFIFGPLTAFLVSLFVSLIEMITISDTGPIGAIMNFLGSVSFAVTASYIYKKYHTKTGALLGLTSGALCMTIVMLLWNYLITPLYMGLEREVVAAMLIPYFLPFNLLKSGINAGIILFIYKPVVNALRRQEVTAESKKLGLSMLGLGILITCILIVLVWTKVI